MALLERISADMVAAMRAKDQLMLSTLRSIKTALDKYQKDQQKTLDESGEQSILGSRHGNLHGRIQHHL
jgi:uncharacterized protein YqeY